MLEATEHDGVWELRLEQPPLNEIGLDMVAGLERVLGAIEARGARALVIHSGLERGFCAGADLRALHAQIVGRPPDAWMPSLRAFVDRIHGVMNRLDALPCTTVGAIHGVCFGGGFELALTLDVLVADKTARFAFPELRLGIIPGFGGIPRLSREAPAGVVRDLVLTGRSLNAARAHALGLVGHLVAKGEALAIAREVARQAARFDAVAQARAKAFMKRAPTEELAREKEEFLALFARPGVVEALGRFVTSTDPMPYLPAGDRGAS
jgi:enoyl-CoA hydratase/carnithine racemase